jgi:hypothetical protein
MKGVEIEDDKHLKSAVEGRRSRFLSSGLEKCRMVEADRRLVS